MKRSRLFLLIAVFAVFLLTNAVSAALDLGVDEITLDPGGFYEFTPQDGIVYWYVSDESVIELGSEETMGVKALQPGTAVVFAMSEDRSEADSCVVTVTGEAKAVKSGDLYYQDLTAEDLAKVNDPAIASVLSMAANTEAFPMGIGDLSGYEYKVLVYVKDGSQQKIADAAEAMGLADVWAYKYVSMAALKGDANDIARLLVEYRDDIVSVETDREYSVDSFEDNGISKLNETAEKLSEVKVAHALGYTGQNQYVAIIDSGVDTRHKEFWTAEENEEERSERFKYAHCYSSSQEPEEAKITKDGIEQTVYEALNSVCEEHGDNVDSSIPYTSSDASKEYFQHGTHVAGIAVGTYSGVASGATLIPVQAFTETVDYEQNAEGTGPDESTAVYGMTMFASDEQRALEYILGLINNENIEVASLNMSYGSLKNSGVGYDSEDTDYINGSLLEQIRETGTVLCASSGNDQLDGAIRTPAASPYVFAVGALAENTTPTVAVFSNHSDLVNILAPGTNIKSSIGYDYWEEKDDYASWYGYNTGTSMATPMVSGAFALLKQLNSGMGAEMTAEELEQQLLGMTDKTAARAGVEKPVLNFAGFYAYTVDEPMPDNEYTVDSSNRTIKVNTYAPENEDASLDGYKVELYKSGGTTPVQTQYAAADKNRTLTFSNLTNDTLYSVKVYKYIEVSKTKYYSAASEGFAVPMAVPSGLTLTASGGNSITAGWKNHPNDRINVEYSDDKTFESYDSCEVPAGDSGSCEIENLEQNKLYYFRFRSILNFEETDYYSPYSSVSTYYLPPVPQESKHFTVSNGNKSITVTLNADTANYNGYKVDIFNPATNKVVGTKTLGVSKNTPVTFTNLTNDTVYEVRVYGYKTVSKVNYFSACASVKERPMAVPTGLKLTVDESNYVTATWEGHAEDKFVVEYAENSSTYTDYCNGTGTCTGTAALQQNTVYYFRFRSVWSDEAGELNFESPASTVLTKLILDKPAENTNFKVSTGNRSIIVNLYTGTPKYTGYKVEVYLGAKCVSTKTIAVSNNQTLNVSNLTNDQAYSVKVYGYRTVNKVNYFSDSTLVAKAVPMAVPSGIVLTRESSDSVKVEWPKNKTDQISVEISDKQNEGYIEKCDKASTGSCTVSDLVADKTYYFRVRRYNAGLEYYSAYSAVSTFRIPSAPTSGTHFEVGNGNRIITVTLKKDANANYDGYKVEIYNPTQSKVVASKTQSVPKNGTTTLSFSGLVNETVYEVRVYGYKTVNKVNYFSESTMVKMAPMAVPTGLTYTAKEDNTVTAEWPNNTGKQIQVEYKEENGTYEKYCEADGSNTCTGKALDKDTVYYFRARWLNKNCDVYSPWSAEVSKMLLSIPTTEESTIGYKKIRVHFNDVSTLTGHQIKVYTVSPEKLVRTVNVKYASNKDFADITGLNNGTEYRFEISAYRTVGKTTYYSEAAKVTATPQLKPIDTDAPQGVKTSGGAKKITVSWTKDTWTGGHYIELYRMDNKVMAANAYAANNATSYTFSGGNIEYDVPYMVRVWKYNEKSPKAVGNSYVDTYAVSLATPGSFNAVTADGSITISWTYSGSADKIVAYYSSTSNKGPFDGQVDCSIEGGKNTCTIPNLTNSTLYYVKAAAVRTLAGASEETEDDVTITSVETAVKSAVPLPVLKNATVTVASKTVTVQYTKDNTVDGHIIQLYKLDNKGKASVVKTVTSDNSKVTGETVTIEFSKLANGTTYYVTICSYDKIGKTTYRGAIYTSGKVTPTDTSSASKDVVIMTEMTEPFDGFVDPVEELNAEAEAEAAVETEVKEEEEQTSVFDLFRL